MPELVEKSLVEIAALIRQGAVSPVEVLEAHWRRIEKHNPGLRAIVTLNPKAVEQARVAEQAVFAGQPLGPLHGVPLTIKDTINTEGLRTACGSRLLKRHLPQQDAPAVARLKAAGAIILGKTNVSELATAYDANNPLFGSTNNPYNLGRVPGGSSGGEAAAISACLSPGGLGSDLAGSVRVPAHLCGIVGLKPTNGVVAYDGQWPHAVGPLSLGATVGPMARRVADVQLLFELMNLRRRSGSRSFVEPGAYLSAYANRLRRRRFLWYTDDGHTPVAPDVAAAVAAAVKALEDYGLEGRQERPAGIEHGPRLWGELFSHAVAEQLTQLYAGHQDQAGPVLQAIFRQHAQRPAPTLEAFAKAWTERDEWRGLLLRALEETAFLVAPVGAVAAWPHDARKVSVNGHQLSLFHAFGHAQTFNVFGFPAVAVPVTQTPEGLPVGVQIVGRPYAEHEILAAATIIETTLGGWRKVKDEG